MIIKLEQVTKNYGNVQGISNINLEVSKGITAVSYTHLTMPTICSV